MDTLAKTPVSTTKLGLMGVVGVGGVMGWGDEESGSSSIRVYPVPIANPNGCALPDVVVLCRVIGRMPGDLML